MVKPNRIYIEKLQNLLQKLEGLIDSRTPRNLPAAIKEQKQSQMHAPLIHLQPKYVIADELHLLLRITDLLTRNLINAALQHNVQHSDHRRHIDSETT